MNLPLNIDWQQILLHLFNFVVLFAILYFLLYKPVKDFMEKRTEYYKKLAEDARANLEASEKVKAEYTDRLAAVEDEIADKKEKARRELEESCAEKQKLAEMKAEKIVEEAHQTLEKERAKMLKEAQNDISDMVVSAVEKIVLQKSTSESFDQFLDTVERGGKHE